MRVGSLFTGYGGLDLAVGGDLAWYAEVDAACIRILEAHYPGVPNLGDVTTVEWDQVEPVDVVTAGYPCQPFSTAGKRKGTNDERHLWPYVAECVRVLRPWRLVLENVRGHVTLGLDVVLSDLARMGRDARWGVVRASDAGAPHDRARVFIVSDAADADPRRYGGAQDARGMGRVASGASGEAHDERERTRRLVDTSGLETVPGPGSRRWGTSRPPTEPAQGRRVQRPADDDREPDWGAYRDAIKRWELLTRHSPAPTIHRDGRPRLNALWIEWLMGLPEGWVTGHGLNDRTAIERLGNGVVPQQARLAIDLLTRENK